MHSFDLVPEASGFYNNATMLLVFIIIEPVDD